jgi:hypothetical protein
MSSITPIELRVVETVLGMGSGYVLDFTNRSFSEFFRAQQVNIDGERYAGEGVSKANRLRCFLHSAPDRSAAQVLNELLKYRAFIDSPPDAKKQDLDFYSAAVLRLSGHVAPTTEASTTAGGSESDLLRLVLKPDGFLSLPIEEALARAMLDRMNEAQRCIDAKAYLAAVILCGSVLEGVCLGYGASHPEQVNRACSAQYGKDPRRLTDWHLSEWIDVLARAGVLSQNVVKFGVGLRDFRNYVHPAAQLSTGFAPDLHTARIGFQVVVAAVDDMATATATATGKA